MGPMPRLPGGGGGRWGWECRQRVFLLYPVVLMAGGGGDGSSPSDLLISLQSQRGAKSPEPTPLHPTHNKRLSRYLYMPGG